MKEKQSLVKNSIFNILYQMLNVIFPFLTSVYVSHILLDTGVGKVAYAQNIASYFVTLAPLGVLSYGVKEIAIAGSNVENRNKKFTELFIINFISTTIFTGVYYVLISQTDSFKGNEMLLYVCGIQIVLNYINVDWLYQGLEEYGYITIRSFLVKIISFILLFIMVRSKQDYINYAWITCIATGGNNIFNVIYMRRYVKFDFKKLNFMRHLGPELVLAGNIFLSNFYSKIDVTMLGFLKGDAATGYYSNAFKIINIIMCLCAAITSTFLPRLSYCYEYDKKEFSKLVNKGTKYILFLTIPATIGLAMIANLIIPRLFGEAFRPAALTVIVLTPLILIKGIGSLICYQVAISSGNEKKQMIAYVVGAIINIFLNVMLIPKFAENGAAIASVVAELFINIIVFVQVKCLVKIQIEWRFLGSTLFSIGIMIILVECLLKINISNVLLKSCICIIIAGMEYIFVNIILKNEIMQEIMQYVKSFRKKI
ncbi:MAG: flippase [Lachnospiraceae bacterium]|nr:flippase [Lachnospiraceae bacterium]